MAAVIVAATPSGSSAKQFSRSADTGTSTAADELATMAEHLLLGHGAVEPAPAWRRSRRSSSPVPRTRARRTSGRTRCPRRWASAAGCPGRARRGSAGRARFGQGEGRSRSRTRWRGALWRRPCGQRSGAVSGPDQAPLVAHFRAPFVRNWGSASTDRQRKACNGLLPGCKPKLQHRAVSSGGGRRDRAPAVYAACASGSASTSWRGKGK